MISCLFIILNEQKFGVSGKSSCQQSAM